MSVIRQEGYSEPSDAPSARVGPLPVSESPTAWLSKRYLPLAWISLFTAIGVHLFIGSEAEVALDAWFLGLNILGEIVHRTRPRFMVPLHLAGLGPMILWYCALPTSVPAELGEQALIFASLCVLPNIILVSLYGLRTAYLSTPLLITGVWALATSAAEVATGVFLIVVSGVIGGLFFHRLLLSLEEAQRRLAAAALSDPMTGIGNRRALETDFTRVAARVDGTDDLLVSVWDLDGLKEVNDEYGHAAGDRYLRNFVRALDSACTEQCRIYRLGGDEFVGVHGRDVDRDQLVRHVRHLFPNVSVGIIAAGGKDLADVLAEADRRLYRDKRSRNGGPPPQAAARGRSPQIAGLGGHDGPEASNVVPAGETARWALLP